jgi:Ca-activated chloride channel family protein
MTFLWPQVLWLLPVLPALVALYVWLLRRKRKTAVRYASLGLVKVAAGRGQALRRHVPPLLFLIAIGCLVLAAARPRAVVTLPFEHETIILAMDVSLSMHATDVEPSRLEAAQAAARDFVASQPGGTRIGVVSFAGTASLVQPPTTSREDVLAAIDGFQLQRATAVGSGILVSLKAVFPDLDFDLVSSEPRREPSRRADRGTPLEPGAKREPPARKRVAPGSYKSAVIILLSDGQTTTGPNPIEAARIAADTGVRVFTVGFGTANGEVIIGDRYRFRVRLDEEALKEIASLTGGEYSYAGTAVDLKKIYQMLNSRLVLEKKEQEVGALFAGGAALLSLLAAALSVAWFNRMG